MMTRAEKLVFVRAGDGLVFRDLAETLDSISDSVDKVALLTPSVEKQVGLD
jgi:hypothetical protein